MSTTITEVTFHTEYWDNRQNAWLPCGDYGNGGTLDHVPTTLEQARAAAADAWDTYIADWVGAGYWAGTEEPAASYRLAWDDAHAEYDDEHIATVEIDVVRDDDTDAVIGYELGAVELYQP